MLIYGKYECFIMQTLYGCVLWQFSMLHDMLMLVEDARGDHMEEAYSRADLMTAL